MVTFPKKRFREEHTRKYARRTYRAKGAEILFKFICRAGGHASEMKLWYGDFHNLGVSKFMFSHIRKTQQPHTLVMNIYNSIK